MASTVTHTGGGRGRGGRVTPGKAWRSLRSALPVAMAAAIFAWDLGTPPGVAIGVLYVMPVIFSLWQPWAGAPCLAAGAGSVLQILAVDGKSGGVGKEVAARGVV